jgi:hypothetical protein
VPALRKATSVTGKILSAALAALTIAAATAPAGATGTATVRQSDGTVKTYTSVKVRLAREELALTSSDGQGTLVIAKAACTKAGSLVECLPYDATLFQGGQEREIVLRSGTVWLNPTTSPQLMPNSYAHVQPHGVVVSITSKSGTHVSFTGTVDEVQK